MPQPRHFSWEPCALPIVSAAGEPVLQCVADTGARYGLTVSLARELAWDPDRASWRWHKTWRVPDLHVEAHGPGLEARVHVVCPGRTGGVLEDAGVGASGVKGDIRAGIVDGECRFSRLRLVGTTNTLGGRLFHIVVSLVNAAGTCVASVISTAFAVYSRKNADKKRKAIDKTAMEEGRWSEGYSFVPFNPKELDKQFVKKITDGHGNLIEEIIDNSWQGLLSYFQAPNIRFKVRHPLFLAIRFSNVLCILRDSFRFPDESENALRSFICSCGFPLSCVTDPAVALGHGDFLPPWLIAFRSSAFDQCPPPVRHKLAELMSVVKGPALGFVPDDSLVPKRYFPTFDVKSLGQLYTQLHACEFATQPKQEPQSRKRAKSEDEPVPNQEASTFFPAQKPCAMATTEVVEEMSSSAFGPHATSAASNSDCTTSTAQEVRDRFQSYFISLHAELRMLLTKTVELATMCVANGTDAAVDNLRRAYHDFTEALSVHAHVEETVLFKELSARVPKLTESYVWDHHLEKGRLAEIENLFLNTDSKKIAELFMKIAELAAVHNTHMEKEESHLLPYFLNTFDDSEICRIIRNSDKTINLLNPRHRNAIDRALIAVGREPQDDISDDAPEDADENLYFPELPQNDDVMALIDEMM